MRAPVFFLFLLVFSLDLAGQTASCFDHFLKEGEAALARRRPNYELARKKFAAAKECDGATYEQKRDMERRIREVEERNLNALENEIDRAEAARDEARLQKTEADSMRSVAVAALENTEKALKKADSLRLEAQKSARRALGNDLAFKAQTALRDGDRTTAFRLAEMSWRFVDPDNQRTEQALVEIFFQNEKTKNARPLAWKKAAFALNEFENPIFLSVSSDGKAVATACDGAGSVRFWEAQSGRELFSAFETGQIQAVAAADEGRFLVYATQNGLFVWQKNGPPEARAIYEANFETVQKLWLTADQRLVLALFDNHKAILFDLETGAERGRFGFEKGQGGAWSQVSGDGKRLFLACQSGLLQSISLETGRVVGQIESAGGLLLAFAQTFDGSRAAISRPDRSLEIWDFEKGQAALQFRPEPLAAIALVFTPDDRFLAALYSNGQGRKWDAATGQLVDQNPDAQTDPSLQFAFSEASRDGAWRMKYENYEQLDLFLTKNISLDGKPTRSETFDHLISLARFSPDCRSVFVGLENGEAWLFDPATGERQITFSNEKPVGLAEFAQKAPVLALARQNGAIEIWATEAATSLFPVAEKGQKSAPDGVDFLISPDEKKLAVSFLGDSVQVRSTDEGRLFFTKKDAGAIVVFSPDGQRLGLFHFGQPTFSIFDAQSGALLKTVEKKGGAGIFNAVFSPDGQFLQLYDLGDTASTTLFETKNWSEKSLPTGACFVVFSKKKGASILVLDAWASLQPFDLEKNEPLGPRLFFEPHSIQNLRFSPTGDRFFFTEYGSELRVFEFPSGKKIWEDQLGDQRRIDWSADGERIVSAGYFLAAWDARTGEKLFDLPFSGYLSDFSADGRLLLTVEKQREAVVFDARTGQKLVTLRGRGLIRNVGFSPDSRRVVTACDEGFAEVWDAATGRQLYLLQGDSFSIEMAVFFEKGEKLAILQGNSVKIWALDAPTILEKTNASGPLAPLSANQIFDFLSGEAVFENADWGHLREEISAPQALELGRYFARQADLGRSVAVYDKNFGLAEQFFRSALNDLGSRSILLELADATAAQVSRALASGRRDEAQKRARQVEKMLAGAGGELPSFSKISLAQAFNVLGKKEAAEALFSQVFVFDTAMANDYLYQIEQNSRAVSNLDSTEYESDERLRESIQKKRSPNDAAVTLTPPDELFGTSFDLFQAGKVGPAIAAGRRELSRALDGHLSYPFSGTAGQVAAAMGNLSFYILFEKGFEESKGLAEMGLAVDSSQHFIRTNLAHAELFLGNWKKAAAHYSALKNQPDPSVEGQNFGKTMLGDLEKLREAGIVCRDMEKAVSLLKK